MSATDTSLPRAVDPYRVGRGRDWLSAGGIGGYVYATGHGEGGLPELGWKTLRGGTLTRIEPVQSAKVGCPKKEEAYFRLTEVIG
jgi:hypothetical protein